MADELIQIVDENDQPVGGATKQQAWEDGLIHRIVRVLVFDASGRILLQKRSPGQVLYPGAWDNSAAGHVDVDEAYEVAASRELDEELGINGLPLEEIGYYYIDVTWQDKKMKRFAKVYKVVIDGTPKNFSKREVSQVRWMTPDEVKKLVNKSPDKVTDGLEQVASRFL